MIENGEMKLKFCNIKTTIENSFHLKRKRFSSFSDFYINLYQKN